MNPYRAFACIIAISSVSVPVAAGPLEMPTEVANTNLGMTAKDLVLARPAAKHTTSKAPVDPEKIKSGKIALLEDLPAGGIFHTASYWLDDGRVIAIVLGGTCPPGNEGAMRQRLIRDGVQRWGKRFSKLAKGSNSPGKPQPQIAWEVEGITIELELPRNRTKDEKRPIYFGLSFLRSSDVQKHPRKAAKMTEAERRAFFKGHDLDE